MSCSPLQTLLKTSLMIIIPGIFSCKKSETAEPQTVFSFKANDISYNWSNQNSAGTVPQGAIISKLSTTAGVDYYVLEGLDRSSDMFLNLAMFTNSLQKTTYTTLTTDPATIFYSVYKINDVYCAPMNTGDSVEVIVSDITDNFASGRFKAVMRNPATGAKIEITEGSFEHVRILP